MSTRWPWSHEGYGESSSEGEGYCHAYSTGMSPSESLSSWTSKSYVSAMSSARVRDAAAALERELRALANRLSVAEFHALRTRLEDCCDDILLNRI
jgi:hypothetical protein